jgi:hypothetical protein
LVFLGVILDHAEELIEFDVTGTVFVDFSDQSFDFIDVLGEAETDQHFFHVVNCN